jgi:hypothetical protein
MSRGIEGKPVFRDEKLIGNLIFPERAFEKE